MRRCIVMEEQWSWCSFYFTIGCQYVIVFIQPGIKMFTDRMFEWSANL
jgi:hypothetical protein